MFIIRGGVFNKWEKGLGVVGASGIGLDGLLCLAFGLSGRECSRNSFGFGVFTRLCAGSLMSTGIKMEAQSRGAFRLSV